MSKASSFTRLALHRRQTSLVVGGYDYRIRHSSNFFRRSTYLAGVVPLWSSCFSSMANSSKNSSSKYSSSSNKKTSNSNSIINNTKNNNNNHDDDYDERYGCQPRISEKVTNVFRRRLFHANVVVDDDLDELIDWKETFSSLDYDNPWSAYIPLPTTKISTTAFEQNHVNTSKRGRVVESQYETQPYFNSKSEQTR